MRERCVWGEEEGEGEFMTVVLLTTVLLLVTLLLLLVMLTLLLNMTEMFVVLRLVGRVTPLLMVVVDGEEGALGILGEEGALGFFVTELLLFVVTVPLTFVALSVRALVGLGGSGGGTDATGMNIAERCARDFAVAGSCAFVGADVENVDERPPPPAEGTAERPS